MASDNHVADEALTELADLRERLLAYSPSVDYRFRDWERLRLELDVLVLTIGGRVAALSVAEACVVAWRPVVAAACDNASHLGEFGPRGVAICDAVDEIPLELRPSEEPDAPSTTTG